MLLLNSSCWTQFNLLTRALPPTVAQEEGVGLSTREWEADVVLRPIVAQNEGGVDDLVKLDADQIF